MSIIAHFLFTYKRNCVNIICRGCDIIIHLQKSAKPAAFLLYGLLFYGCVKYVLPLLLPFLFGLSVAALVQKPAALLSSRVPHLSRKVCCVLMTAALLLVIGMVVCGAVCSAVGSAMSFCPGIPDMLARTREWMRTSAAGAGQSAWGRFVGFVSVGAEWCLDFFSENYRQYLPSLLQRSTSLVSALPAAFTATVFGVMASLFACGEFDRIRRTVKEFLPDSMADTLSFVLRTTVHTLTALLKTYGTLMAITFGELALGFALLRLMGYDTGNILTNALVISLIDILPVLGTGTVLIPWGLFEMVTGQWTLGLLLLGMFAVIGTVRNFLEPRFIAEHLELPPFFTLAGVYIGGKLFGAAGILVMPLAMLLVKRLREVNENLVGSGK